MATKKKKVVESESNGISKKAKGLFDHINHLREKQDPKYFDTLEEADIKTWSNYMVCRFLSMQPDIVDLVNEVQVYASILGPREFYKLCLLIVPKGRAYFPYVKGEAEDKWKPELVDLLRSHFEESKKNVLGYLSILTEKELSEILSSYGYTEKEIVKLLK